ncbi:26S proteasome non-ATPase regulatory subunit 13 [Carpediemonas membranifera]|uniref:26S proteasome non-ATPase regulatory subunit 13 n=1 Tax=Carpediemonas membranifera TaxID=201153 RepID=A0A8J6ASS7_9EUKA|nr:26S proteasome non-ATPase regulatory subunit 13 [Carpediemonas membranifera]|eukprot:KAG9390585.1 26S proteasome non-ATPase regulatory subunit 13 [Carpediemonas membranifera]
MQGVIDSIQHNRNQELWYNLGSDLVSFCNEKHMIGQSMPLVEVYNTFVREIVENLYPLHVAIMIDAIVREDSSAASIVADLKQQPFTSKNAILSQSMSLIEARISVKNGAVPDDDELAAQFGDVATETAVIDMLLQHLYIEISMARRDHTALVDRMIAYDSARGLAGVTLAPSQEAAFAVTLITAALVADRILTFDDVVAVECIKNPAAVDAAQAWMPAMLAAIHAGNVPEVAQMTQQHGQQLTALSAADPVGLVLRKAKISALLALVFSRDSQHWTFSFEEIAAVIAGTEREAEDVALAALSHGLLRGRIQATTASVEVTWLKPRPLTLDQTRALKDKLQAWFGQVVAANEMVVTAKDRAGQMTALFEE